MTGNDAAKSLAGLAGLIFLSASAGFYLLNLNNNKLHSPFKKNDETQRSPIIEMTEELQESPQEIPPKESDTTQPYLDEHNNHGKNLSSTDSLSNPSSFFKVESKETMSPRAKNAKIPNVTTSESNHHDFVIIHSGMTPGSSPGTSPNRK